MDSMKCGEIEGSPPENCTDICRRGLIEIALLSMSLTSSKESSWTKPTWFASMKQGSHIMLQRFVRSTVRTEPRPNLIELEPWSCRPLSLCACMSRPGNNDKGLHDHGSSSIKFGRADPCRCAPVCRDRGTSPRCA